MDDLVYITIGLVGMIVLIFGGLFFVMNNFSNEMDELHAEQERLQAIERQIWDKLDCNDKHEYLENKDLTSSTIFYDNQNEQFYREYVIDCMNMPHILENGI
jgi:hypothetical protein